MDVSGQLHAALSPAKKPPLSVGEEAGMLPSSGVDWVSKKILHLPCRECNPGRSARGVVPYTTVCLPRL